MPKEEKRCQGNQSDPVPTPAVLTSRTISTARSMKQTPAGSTNKYERSADVNKKYGRAWENASVTATLRRILCARCVLKEEG